MKRSPLSSVGMRSARDFRLRRLFVAVLGLLLVVVAGPGVRADQPPRDAQDWNGAEIVWHDYASGLAQAERTGKPVLTVFHANWCPHCRTFRAVFKSPDIVSLAKSFVLVIVNIDDEPAINRKYAIDGGYVPRTMVLDAKGVVRTALRDQQAREYQYFVDPRSPDALLELMLRAM
ncbi:MAG: hypothetical protein GC150_06675 [Rhizobiales bacterium]|nr:hypothetical protein [Hyphomicrobiales bacterium]